MLFRPRFLTSVSRDWAASALLLLTMGLSSISFKLFCEIITESLFNSKLPMAMMRLPLPNVLMRGKFDLLPTLTVSGCRIGLPTFIACFGETITVASSSCICCSASTRLPKSASVFKGSSASSILLFLFNYACWMEYLLGNVEQPTLFFSDKNGVLPRPMLWAASIIYAYRLSLRRRNGDLAPGMRSISWEARSSTKVAVP